MCCSTVLHISALHMNYYAGPRDYVVNLHSPWRTPRRSPSHTQKQNPTLSWQTRPSRCEFRAQTPTLSLRVLCIVLCTELATTGSEFVTTCRKIEKRLPDDIELFQKITLYSPYYQFSQDKKPRFRDLPFVDQLQDDVNAIEEHSRQ